MFVNMLREFLKRHWLLILSFVYVFSPIDIIPEFLVFLVGPGVLIDDALVLVIGIIHAIYKERQAAAERSNFIEVEVTDTTT